MSDQIDAEGAEMHTARLLRTAAFGAVPVAVVLSVVAAATALTTVPTDTGQVREETRRSVACGGTAGGGQARRSQENSREIFRLYLDPAGSDAGDGCSPQTAVRSLAQVQRLIVEARPTTDVEVRIRQGLYSSPPLRWSTYVPGRSITFLPLDYDHGQGRNASGERPIFRGDKTSGFWFKAVLPPGHQGGHTRLRFYHLQVERYSGGGIMFDGGTTTGNGRIVSPGTAGVNGNTVHGMAFRAMGSKYTPVGLGYGAVDLINSRENVIENNTFANIENSGGPERTGLAHGVYLAHYSGGNIIRNNQFKMVSGDPVRTRNNSNDNQISSNTFKRAGANSYLSDWFRQAVQPHDAKECASHGTRFFDNTLISGYSGSIRAWSVSPGERTYRGGSGCADHRDRPVLAWGNSLR